MHHSNKRILAVVLGSPAIVPVAPVQEHCRSPCKLATIICLLQPPDGATISKLCEATGWQSHSVRGALAGTVKRKGYVVTSLKPVDGPRRYRIEASA